MAYKSDGLQLLFGAFSTGNQYNKWCLNTEDTLATIVADDDYITDATKRGMHVGDVVEVRQWGDSGNANAAKFTSQYDRGDVIINYGICIVKAINADGEADLAPYAIDGSVA